LKTKEKNIITIKGAIIRCSNGEAFLLSLLTRRMK